MIILWRQVHRSDSLPCRVITDTGKSGLQILTPNSLTIFCAAAKRLLRAINSWAISVWRNDSWQLLDVYARDNDVIGTLIADWLVL